MLLEGGLKLKKKVKNSSIRIKGTRFAGDVAIGKNAKVMKQTANSKNHWWEKPIGIVILGIIIVVLAAIITRILGLV